MGNNFGYYAAGMIVGNLTASVAIGAVSGGLANMSCIGSAANIARMVGQTLKAAMVVSDAYTVAGAVNEFGETGHWGLNQTLALATVAGHGIGYAAGKLKAPKCFVEGTQVLAQDETGQAVSTNIEEIEVGDWVWSRNEETGEEGFKPVVQLFRNQTDTLVHLTYTTAAGEATLTGTEEHPFWSLTRNTWVGMGGLHTGERLQLVGGQTATATTVRRERLSKPVTVYNFEVADWHTHHVGTADTGWVFVHNKCEIGPYETTGGHHIHQKAAFRGHPNYSEGKALALSQDAMSKNGWIHQPNMNRAQRRLMDALERSGRARTATPDQLMSIHNRIAELTLRAGGVPRAKAKKFVQASLKNLQSQGVYSPTRTPWN